MATVGVKGLINSTRVARQRKPQQTSSDSRLSVDKEQRHRTSPGGAVFSLKLGSNMQPLVI